MRRSTADPLPKSQNNTATRKYNAKVMLMQGLPKDWLNALDETHLSKLIKFMCVKNAKYGVMCMGGMWQQELDGGAEGAPDSAGAMFTCVTSTTVQILTPDNLSALIKTAIRHVKDTVDLDLSAVTTWHRFLEITYHRPAETYKGTSYPEQIETTVIFLPELAPAMPDQPSYDARVSQLKAELDAKALEAWEVRTLLALLVQRYKF